MSRMFALLSTILLLIGVVGLLWSISNGNDIATLLFAAVIALNLVTWWRS